MSAADLSEIRCVLVTGGAGFIGSHTVLELLLRGVDVTVLDSLVNSSEEALRRVRALVAAAAAEAAAAGRAAPGALEFERLDLLDARALDAAVARRRFDAVIHFAALKAVGESVAKPLAYYRNNVGSLLNLLESCAAHGIDRIVFSSSATVYGATAAPPMREEDEVGRDILNPYGATKFMAERILRDYCAARPQAQVACLRYFNPVGAHPSGRIGEDPRGVPSNLVPYIQRVAAGRLERLTVHGGDWEDSPDGTAQRDYLHVVDLALGHIAALRWLGTLPAGRSAFEAVNLGTGSAVSVMQMLRAYERACGRALPFTVGPRRAGDAGSVWADASKAKALFGWVATKTLDDMVVDSWRWASMNPDGYGDSS